MIVHRRANAAQDDADAHRSGHSVLASFPHFAAYSPSNPRIREIVVDTTIVIPYASGVASSTLQHEIKKRRPFDLPEEEALLNLRRTASFLGNQEERFLKAYGISEAQYNALRILRGAKLGGDAALPCLEVAERMITAVPDITRLVDRMEHAGLVDRRRTKEDRRVVLVSITKAGLDLLARIDKPLTELIRGQLGHLSRSELGALNRLLVKARRPGP